MGWIEKRTRPGGMHSWRVSWREDGARQSETFGQDHAVQAKAFLRDAEAAGERWPAGWVKGRGYPTDDELLCGYTVRSAAIRAIDVNQQAARGTLADYRRELDRYLPESDPIASIPVERVTVDEILEWHIRLAGRGKNSGGPVKSQRVTDEPLSAKTRRAAHSRLSSGLTLMVKMGHIGSNPAIGLGPGKSKRKRIQALSVDEYLILRDYVPEHYRALVETLARTGMRFSEVTALVARRVVLDGDLPLINVQDAWKRTEKWGRYEKGGPKSLEGNRVVPIDPELVDLLRPIKEARKGSEELFKTTYDTVVLYNNFHQRIWRPAVRKAVADDALPFAPTIHDLRHAHASWLLAAGIPVLTVADRLGHDPAVLLRIYAHLLDQARSAPAEAIQQMFSATHGDGDSLLSAA